MYPQTRQTKVSSRCKIVFSFPISFQVVVLVVLSLVLGAQLQYSQRCTQNAKRSSLSPTNTIFIVSGHKITWETKHVLINYHIIYTDKHHFHSQPQL